MREAHQSSFAKSDAGQPLVATGKPRGEDERSSRHRGICCSAAPVVRFSTLPVTSRRINISTPASCGVHVVYSPLADRPLEFHYHSN